MNDLIKDVAVLSTINEKSLRKLITLANYSIVESVKEDSIGDKDNSVTEIDIGIGRLLISYKDFSNVLFKFIPSDELIKNIKATHSSDGLLIPELEKSLISKIENIYKDIL